MYPINIRIICVTFQQQQLTTKFLLLLIFLIRLSIDVTVREKKTCYFQAKYLHSIAMKRSIRIFFSHLDDRFFFFLFFFFSSSSKVNHNIQLYDSLISITLVFIIAYLSKYQNVITFVLWQRGGGFFPLSLSFIHLVVMVDR